MAREKVGVTVVSGFLGSGKTTLLRRIVRDPVIGPTVAVIVNDLGELGLDQDLIASEGVTPTMRVTSLVSGCVCCTLRSDLGEALLQLGSGAGLAQRPAHILVEPSGVAKASEVSFAINALGFDAPVQTDAVVTLIDAHNALQSLREFPELFEDQARFADLVLLNKRDLVPDPTERAELERLVATLAPRATVLWCERADVDPALLIGHSSLLPGGRLSAESQEHLGDDHAPGHSDPTEARAHAHGVGAPAAHGISACTVPVPDAVDLQALEDFLDGEADRYFRIKGIVGAEVGGELVAVEVQAVGDRVELDVIAADSPLNHARRQLIFIGSAAALAKRGLAEAALGVATQQEEDRLRAELSRCARGGI